MGLRDDFHADFAKHFLSEDVTTDAEVTPYEDGTAGTPFEIALIDFGNRGDKQVGSYGEETSRRAAFQCSLRDYIAGAGREPRPGDTVEFDGEIFVVQGHVKNLAETVSLECEFREDTARLVNPEDHQK